MVVGEGGGRRGAVAVGPVAVGPLGVRHVGRGSVEEKRSRRCVGVAGTRLAW